MGMYRSIYADRTCEHCGGIFRAEIQFKTANDWCQTYELAQIVTPDKAFSPGEEYHACVDRYCAPCMLHHNIASCRAKYSVYASLIRDGQLRCRNTSTGKKLSAIDLAA